MIAMEHPYVSMRAADYLFAHRILPILSALIGSAMDAVAYTRVGQIKCKDSAPCFYITCARIALSDH